MFSHSGLHSKREASLGYIERPCVKSKPDKNPKFGGLAYNSVGRVFASNAGGFRVEVQGLNPSTA